MPAQLSYRDFNLSRARTTGPVGPSSNEIANGLPVSATLWFLLSGFLVILALTAGVVYGFTGLISTAYIVSIFSFALLSFVCGSLSIPGDIQDAGETEEIDWNEVNVSLNYTLWMLLSGACLSWEFVFTALARQGIPDLAGAQVFSAAGSLLSYALGAGIWNCRKPLSRETAQAEIAPEVEIEKPQAEIVKSQPQIEQPQVQIEKSQAQVEKPQVQIAEPQVEKLEEQKKEETEIKIEKIVEEKTIKVCDDSPYAAILQSLERAAEEASKGLNKYQAARTEAMVTKLFKALNENTAAKVSTLEPKGEQSGDREDTLEFAVDSHTTIERVLELTVSNSERLIG